MNKFAIITNDGMTTEGTTSHDYGMFYDLFIGPNETKIDTFQFCYEPDAPEPDYDSGGYTYDDNFLEEDPTVQDKYAIDWVEEPYLVVSTSDALSETMVFPGDENGRITSYGEIGLFDERIGSENWRDHSHMMRALYPDYELVRPILADGLPGPRTLWKKRTMPA